MADQPRPRVFYLKIGLGAFVIIVGAIVAGMLIVDEIRKAEIRGAIRDVQQKIDADAKQRSDAAAIAAARQAKIDAINAEITAAEDEYRSAAAMVNQPISAATRKEEVEESDRRYKEAKRLEAKVIELRAKLAEASR